MTTAYMLASRFVGVKEIGGAAANPLIVAMLQLEDKSVVSDEVAWCSAFVNAIAWLLALQRSRSLAARSWLRLTPAIELKDAIVGFDVVVLKRGGENQPGPDVLAAQGHVGFFGGMSLDRSEVLVLGGNQSNAVSVESFPVSRVLGVRRLA